MNKKNDAFPEDRIIEDIFDEEDLVAPTIEQKSENQDLAEDVDLDSKVETATNGDSYSPVKSEGWDEPIEVISVSAKAVKNGKKSSKPSPKKKLAVAVVPEFPQDEPVMKRKAENPSHHSDASGEGEFGDQVMDVGSGLAAAEKVTLKAPAAPGPSSQDDRSQAGMESDTGKKKKKKKPIWVKILIGLLIFLAIAALAGVLAIMYFTRGMTMDTTSHNDADLGIGTVVEWSDGYLEESSDELSLSGTSSIEESSGKESAAEASSTTENSFSKEYSKHNPPKTGMHDRNAAEGEESIVEESEEESSEEEGETEPDLDNVIYTPVQTVSRDGVYNIALFGLSAEYAFDALRSDSIIILTLDTNHWMIKMTSILRDSKVPIEGYRAQKINAAYRYGGPWLAVKTINQNFGLDVRNYVTVDLGQMEAIINAMGGVYITVTAEEARIIGSEAGSVWLNGRQAVAYCRIRSIGSDTQRAKRQRTVLNYVFYRFKDMSIDEKLGFAQTFLNYVSTSLSWSEIVSYLSLPLSSYGVSTNSVPIQGVDYNVWGGIDSYGEWVWVFDIPSAARRIQNYIFG